MRWMRGQKLKKKMFTIIIQISNFSILQSPVYRYSSDAPNHSLSEYTRKDYLENNNNIIHIYTLYTNSNIGRQKLKIKFQFSKIQSQHLIYPYYLYIRRLIHWKLLYSFNIFRKVNHDDDK